MIRNRHAILALLTGLNFLNYIDRAIVAAVLTPMKAELVLSNFEAGVVNTAFLVGYFASAPWFASRGDRGPRMGLIALGVAIWSVATVASGLSQDLWMLIASRIVVGVGEASFATLAPTVIDDVTPPDRKGKALSVFYLAIPLGYAMGYVLGGILGKQLGWRAAFFLTGGPGILLAATCLLIAEPPRKLVVAKEKLSDVLRELAQLPLFRRAVVGYCAYTAAVGAFSYWAPNFLLQRFPEYLELDDANTWFGIVLIAAGAIGTVIGGQWADRSQKGLPVVTADMPYDAVENRLGVNAMLRICAIGMLVAAPLTVAALLMPLPWMFFVVVFVVEVGLFLSTSPVNAALLRAVPIERRASSMAASIFAIHLFGDLWSSTVLGLLQDALPLVLAMMALPITFAISGYIWWPRAKEAEPNDAPVPAARVVPRKGSDAGP